MSTWIIQKRNELYRGRIFNIQNLHCRHPEKGVEHDFYVLDTPDWINIVALTDEGKIIMVRQHRLGTNEITIETPAGLIEQGEDPGHAARRELEEETGYAPGKITLMKKCSANPAIMSNSIFFYLATGCRKISAQRLDAAEDIEVHLYSPEELISMIQTGEINHTIILTALSLYFMSPVRPDGITHQNYWSQA